MKRLIFCLGTALSLAAGAVLAQGTSSSSTPEVFFQSPVPKDARTRAKTHTELGSLYFQNGDLIIALEELTIAISIDPDYAQAYSTRGVVLYYVKEYASADKDFQKALSLEETNPEISNNYGWFLCNTGREKEAIAYFERAYGNPLYRTPENALLNAGTCYAKLGELDLAEDFVRRSLRFSRDNLQAQYQLANINYKRGNFDAAKKQLMEVVRGSDTSAETLWLLLRIERRLGNSIEESSLVAQLRRKFPESSEYQAFLKGNFE